MKKSACNQISPGALIICFLLVASALCPFGQAQTTSFHNAPASAREVKNPYLGQAPAVLNGKSVYVTNCSACHGNAGQGAGNVPPLSQGVVQTTSDGEIFWYITHGDVNNGMPSWAGLPEKQLWEVVSYVKSLRTSQPGSAPTAPAAFSTPARQSTAPPPKAPFIDYRFERPGTTRHITPADLPAP